MLPAPPTSSTPKQFQQRHNLPKTSFYREVKAGKLMLVKIGRSSRVTREAEEAWLRSLPTIGGEG